MVFLLRRTIGYLVVREHCSALYQKEGSRCPLALYFCKLVTVNFLNQGIVRKRFAVRWL